MCALSFFGFFGASILPTCEAKLIWAFILGVKPKLNSKKFSVIRELSSRTLSARWCLQLGRAYGHLREKSKARNAYQNFFTIWKVAGPDGVILKKAKGEYAKAPVIATTIR
jgi:hypothetical protein